MHQLGPKWAEGDRTVSRSCFSSCSSRSVSRPPFRNWKMTNRMSSLCLLLCRQVTEDGDIVYAFPSLQTSAIGDEENIRRRGLEVRGCGATWMNPCQSLSTVSQSTKLLGIGQRLDFVLLCCLFCHFGVFLCLVLFILCYFTSSFSVFCDKRTPLYTWWKALSLSRFQWPVLSQHKMSSR